MRSKAKKPKIRNYNTTAMAMNAWVLYRNFDCMFERTVNNKTIMNALRYNKNYFMVPIENYN